MKHEQSYGSLVFKQHNNDQRVLMINFNYKRQNVWGFPKGHPQNNENPMQTACRETKEETFIDIEILPGFQKTVTFQLDDSSVIRNRVVTYFVGNPLSEITKAESNKIIAAEWVDIAKAKELVTFECDRIILESAYCFWKAIIQN